MAKAKCIEFTDGELFVAETQTGLLHWMGYELEAGYEERDVKENEDIFLKDGKRFVCTEFDDCFNLIYFKKVQ